MKQHVGKIIFFLILFLGAGLVSLPTTSLPSFLQPYFTDVKVHLGLDLQGGTQLTYAVDTRKAEQMDDVDVLQVVEGVRTTLERRVNGLGVSEPSIYTSQVGEEHHIIVELAGIKDIEEAKAVVGKTIQLEFKTARPQDQIESENPEARPMAAAALVKAIEVDDFSVFAEQQATQDGKIVSETETFFFDELPETHAEKIWNAETGTVIDEVIDFDKGYFIDQSQQIRMNRSVSIVHIGEKAIVDREKTIPGEVFADIAKTYSESYLDEDKNIDFYPQSIRNDLENIPNGEFAPIVETETSVELYRLVERTESKEERAVSHILIAYEGATRADTVTRSKRDAYQLALELEKRLQAGESFADLANEYTDDASNALDGGKGGSLGYITEDSAFVQPFMDAALALQTGDISPVTETEFGFHLITQTDLKPAQASVYTTEKIILPMAEDARSALESIIERTKEKTETNQEEQITLQMVSYSLLPDPWESTGLDGSKFLSATVSSGNGLSPVVNILFNEEGAEMFAELTKANKGKPIAIFVGGSLVSAPMVQQEILGGVAQISGNFNRLTAGQLAMDLNTGAIDAPITLIGQHQVGATIGQQALDTSVQAGMIGILLLFLYMIFQYRAFGLIASVALILYSTILLSIFKLSGLINAPIVVTLAGVAGIVLSIGMAVDANILIFERIKEELATGKRAGTAIAIGFDRAWSSIRDSNISSLITCAILAWFGSSIIRGFAINLSIGILVSMFTAIWITKMLLIVFVPENSQSSKWFV